MVGLRRGLLQDHSIEYSHELATLQESSVLLRPGKQWISAIPTLLDSWGKSRRNCSNSTAGVTESFAPGRVHQQEKSPSSKDVIAS